MNADGVELVREIARRSQAHCATLFLFDADPGERNVRYLFNLGLSVETNRIYQGAICRHDPFIGEGCRRAACSERMPVAIDQEEIEAGTGARGAEPYWEFMHRSGYCETAASVQAVTPGIYLVMGLMRQGRSPGRDRFSMRSARDELGLLFGNVSTWLLRDALRRRPDAETEDGSDAIDDGDRLTPRERDVVDALRRGLRNKQIADALSLSECTVENYLRRIYRKHGVRSRTGLIAALGRG